MKYPTKLADTIHLLAAIQILREISGHAGHELRESLKSSELARICLVESVYQKSLSKSSTFCVK